MPVNPVPPPTRADQAKVVIQAARAAVSRERLIVVFLLGELLGFLAGRAL